MVTPNMTCGQCLHWCGRCLAGKRNRLASSDPCENFIQRLGNEYVKF